MSRPAAPTRSAFFWFSQIPTRWMDVDVYGHVNNVEYYSYFDTAVGQFLYEEADRDPTREREIGLVVETQCHFVKEIAFPRMLDIGLRAERIGRTSVVYAIGIFRGDEDDAAAFGRFVHVYVDRETRRTLPVPAPVRAALETITAPR